MRPKFVDLIVVIAVVAIASIFLYQHAHEPPRTTTAAGAPAATAAPARSADELANRIDAVAATVPAGASRSNAMRAEALRTLDQQQASATGPEKQFLAANAFLGFYWINTKTRAQYCADRGSPIEEFKTEFEARWVKEYAQSLAVLKKNGAGDPETIYQTYVPRFTKQIALDMEDLENSTHVATIPAACAELNRRRAQLIKNLDFAKLSQPNYDALMAPIG